MERSCIWEREVNVLIDKLSSVVEIFMVGRDKIREILSKFGIKLEKFGVKLIVIHSGLSSMTTYRAEFADCSITALRGGGVGLSSASTS